MDGLEDGRQVLSVAYDPAYGVVLQPQEVKLDRSQVMSGARSGFHLAHRDEVKNSDSGIRGSGADHLKLGEIGLGNPERTTRKGDDAV